MSSSAASVVGRPRRAATTRSNVKSTSNRNASFSAATVAATAASSPSPSHRTQTDEFELDNTTTNNRLAGSVRKTTNINKEENDDDDVVNKRRQKRQSDSEQQEHRQFGGQCWLLEQRPMLAVSPHTEPDVTVDNIVHSNTRINRHHHRRGGQNSVLKRRRLKLCGSGKKMVSPLRRTDNDISQTSNRSIDLGKRSSRESSRTIAVCCRTIVKLCLLLTLLATPIVLIGVPLLFRNSLSTRQFFLFMNDFKFPVHTPQHYELSCTRPLNISGLGVWHVRAHFDKHAAHCAEHPEENWFTADNSPVLLYAHGIGGTRATTHRIHLYKLLSQQLGAHVIAFDYAGYGDSARLTPTKPRMVADTRRVLQWAEEQGVKRERVIAYGHSMGTSVMINMAAEMSEEKNQVGAIILEAPIKSIEAILYDHPLTRLFTFLPWFASCFVDPVVSDPNTNFDSEGVLHRVRAPLLVMHSRDDWEVPFEHGKAIYETAKRVQPPQIAAKTAAHWFEHGGHMSMSDSNDNFIEVIQKYLDTLRE